MSWPGNDVSPLYNGRLRAGACEKILRRFAQRVDLLYLNYFPCLPVSPSICLGVCVEFCPSNATKTPLISSPEASVRARYLHLHSPLLASKAFSSSWILVVMYTLTTMETFQP